MLTTALIVAVLAFLVYVVGGIFLKVPQKYLKPAMLVALVLALVYLLADLPPSIIKVCLLFALILSARLMFFRAP